MRTAIRRKKSLAVVLTIVALCTFGLSTAAFAAAPNSHASGHSTAPQAVQEHGGPNNHASTLDGLQNAMQRVQRNLSRHVSHLQDVLGHVPDQAQNALQATVQRMQDRLRALLDSLSRETNDAIQGAPTSA